MINIPTFLINLAERKDRLNEATIELQKQGIEFERFDAVKHSDGKTGLALSIKKIFESNLDKDAILVFEDDAKFLVENGSEIIEKCFEQLKNTDWLMIQFGLNAFLPVTLFSENVLQVKKSYALHAVAYSNNCMKQILNLIRSNYVNDIIYHPLDVLIANNIQIHGNCYCSYPMIVTQREGFSNIENRRLDWKFALEDRFEKQTKHLLVTQ